jgi:hypothetical protein
MTVWAGLLQTMSFFFPPEDRHKYLLRSAVSFLNLSVWTNVNEPVTGVTGSHRSKTLKSTTFSTLCLAIGSRDNHDLWFSHGGMAPVILSSKHWMHRGADKSLARPGMTQATGTEDFSFIYRFYSHNWRNISTIYIYIYIYIYIKRLASKELF